MKIGRDEVVFNTGKTRYANGCIIGLGPDMEVSEGYDGVFYSGPDNEELKDEDKRLTKAELIELAEYMIEQWQNFRSLIVGSTDVLCITRQTLKAFDFPEGMTVADLKAMVRDWPETDEYGDPCEVWLCDGQGLSNQARMATPLNMRQSDDGTKLWADFMLGHEA